MLIQLYRILDNLAKIAVFPQMMSGSAMNTVLFIKVHSFVKSMRLLQTKLNYHLTSRVETIPLSKNSI